MSETAILHDAVDTLREENRKLRARLESSQREIELLNLELDETNRGVVALYAELTDMVNDLLDLAKIEAGRVTISPGWYDMVDIFSALRGMFKPILTNPDVT